MSIFAISDLHLSFGTNKPMDVFGENWIGHVEKIKKDWKEKVKEDDLVLLPGDLSWAMNLKDMIEDFKFLEELPGKKLLLKGNHDYWWTTLKSMRSFLKENDFKTIDFIYNNSYLYNAYIIAGSRGWSAVDCKENEKMLNREKIRLELSLEDGIRNFGEDKPIIICMHYPPANEFVEIIKRYNVKILVYGHLHGESQKEALEGNINGIEYNMVSCDYTDFKLKELVTD